MAYGEIPHDHWHQPDSIDEEKATLSRLEMVEAKVIYGGSVSFVFILLSLLVADRFLP